MVKIRLIQGDITKVTSDVIVNAANTSLLGGGGVDGAIHKAGGPLILEECRTIRNRQGGCNVGEAVVTTAGNLDANLVIHTVGPKWNGGNSDEAQKLKNCYLNSLKLAERNNAHSIAFPNISTGIYGYPKREAASIAISAINSLQPLSIKEVIIVCFDDESFDIYKKLLS